MVDLYELKTLTILNNDGLFVEVWYDNEYFTTTNNYTTYIISENSDVEILTTPFNNRVFKNYIVNGDIVTTNPLVISMSENINIDCVSGYWLGFNVINNDELSIKIEYNNIVDTFNNKVKSYNNIMSGTSIKITCNDSENFEKWLLNGSDIVNNPHTFILDGVKTISCIAKEVNTNKYIFNINTNLGNDTSFTLPLIDAGHYNFIVDWGDGSSNHITTWNDINKNHTYSSHGEYTITLTGLVGRLIRFSGNEEKLISAEFNNVGEIRSIGEIFRNCINLTTFITSNGDWCRNISSLSRMFSGCLSLVNIDVSNWNVENIVLMTYTFYNCPSLTTLNVSEWNTQSVINMSGMFTECKSLMDLDVSGWNMNKVTSIYAMFNGCKSLMDLDISEWDISNIEDMNWLFDNLSVIEHNYDIVLNNWSQQNVQNDVTFNAGTAKFSDVGKTARSYLINTKGWTIIDGGEI